MALPRKFLNEDEELLAELRPHWIFLFGPLFTSIGAWVAIIAIVIVWRNPPGWTNYPFLILALIPGLWLLGRFVRWRSYIIALTSTRVLVRQGIMGRDTVQLRLQRITEVNVKQTLIERVLGTGRVIIDVQGEDDSMTLEMVRKPVVVQRVINSLINEIVGVVRAVIAGVAVRVVPRLLARVERQHVGRYGLAAPGTPFEIRDRLIELDDLRRRGILSEEEFAAKKSELLNRI